MPDDAPGITISPVPPVQGQQMTVTYSGPKPVTLDIDWRPTGLSPTTVTITNDAGTTVTVPATATSVVVSDPTGAASAAGSVVKAAP